MNTKNKLSPPFHPGNASRGLTQLSGQQFQRAMVKPCLAGVVFVADLEAD